jgi:3-deoxy-manno-octulosonate cytidylyltransferase (CMP-KDO synthetase)
VERSLAARNITRALVATDDERVLEAVTSAGFEAVMTRSDHKSGTDRVAEVARNLSEVEIIVNVQGDEPLVAPETIDLAIESLAREQKFTQRRKGAKAQSVSGQWSVANGREQENENPHASAHVYAPLIVTTWEPINDAADVLSDAVVKVVCDEAGRALYFSRAPIPYPRKAVERYGSMEAALENEPALLSSFRKHTGLYVYRREFLLEFASWPQTELERKEALEQLRALDRGVVIKAVEAATTSIGVDTPEDLERVRLLIEGEARVAL